ncbi:peroxiredoxin [Aliiruegeria sabulilitoris]|uniref:peroxiredoxin n=1 Tax=Aliiruegeria sabulilitoris TaxID=1510458 RepID=UPI00082E7BF5|nr:peroxiredoxin [Aliiruegeria sabulilitoris]NDR57155.1 peroxiredoxin [Pseudoruegeria sp. M32A2M]
MYPKRVPEVVFHTRVRNDALAGPNPFEWRQVSSREIFANRRVVLFALPGAFTPACSESHLPGFEAHYDDFMALGIDDVVCLAVNDAFVLHQWARHLGIEKVSMLPDGNGDFSMGMGMLVNRTNQGMGSRSWRYSMYVQNGEIRKVFAEPDFQDNPTGVPVQVSDADTMLAYLRSRQ